MILASNILLLLLASVASSSPIAAYNGTAALEARGERWIVEGWSTADCAGTPDFQDVGNDAVRCEALTRKHGGIRSIKLAGEKYIFGMTVDFEYNPDPHCWGLTDNYYPNPGVCQTVDGSGRKNGYFVMLT